MNALLPDPTPEKGDLYLDEDARIRAAGRRVVRVIGKARKRQREERYEIEVVEHWNEKLIGRKTTVGEHTLLNRYLRISH